MTTAPHAPGAGVRKPPGQEIAGRVYAVVRRAMGKVVLAVVSRGARTTESGWREVLVDAGEHTWRRLWRLRAWWKRRCCDALTRHQREHPCRRFEIGGTCEEHPSVALA